MSQYSASQIPDAPAPIPPPTPLRPTWPKAPAWQRLAGPIITKDIARASRRAGTYWTRVGVLAILLGVLSLTVYGLSDGAYGQAGTTMTSLQKLQQIAPRLVVVTIWFEFVVLGIMSAGATAMSICGERRAGTLWALLATPMQSWEIALGKIVAGGAQILILGLLPLPVLLAVRVFGGVSASSLVLSTAIIVSTCITGLVCGLFASIGAQKVTQATSGAVSMLALQQFGAALLMGIVNLSLPTPAFSSEAFVWVTPASVLAIVSISESVPFGTFDALSLAGAAVSWNLVSAGLIFAGACLRLRRAALRGDVALRPSATKKKKAAPATPAGINPDAQAQTPTKARKRGRSAAIEGHSREVADNPVLWREWATPLLRSRWYLWLVWLGLIVALGYDIAKDGVSETGVHGVVNMIGMVAGVLVVATAASGSFTSEREARTFDILISTPLSARRLVMGKFWGAYRRSWLAFVVVLGHGVVSMALGNMKVLGVVYTALLMMSTIALGGALGMLMSLVAKTTQRATGATLALLGAVWVGIPLILGITSSSWIHLFGSKVSDWAIAALATFHPFAMMALVIDGLDRSWRSGRGTVDYFGAGQVSYLDLGVGILLSGAALIGVCTVLLRWSERKLRAMTGRL